MAQVPAEGLDVMPKDGSRGVAAPQRLELMLVQAREQLGNLVRELAVHLAGTIDLLVVLALGATHLGKALGAHLDAVLAQAVLDDVGDKGCQRP